jgi:hypothetical protein
VPVPFGLGQWSWAASQALDRARRGLMDPGEAAYHVAMNAFKQVLPDSYPAYFPSEDPIAWVFQTFTPQPLRPLTDLAVNKNYWGQQINYGGGTPGQRAYERGRKNTPLYWHHMAKWLDEAGLANTTPESLRYLFNYYLAGPLAGLMTAVESNKINQPMYASTRDELGWFATFLGASRVWSAPQNVAQAVYYRRKNEIERQLTELGVNPSASGTTQHDDKLAYAAMVMREAGMDEELVQEYEAILDAETDLAKLDRDLNKTFRELKFSDMDEEELRYDFEEWSRARQEILEKAVGRF